MIIQDIVEGVVRSVSPTPKKREIEWLSLGGVFVRRVDSAPYSPTASALGYRSRVHVAGTREANKRLLNIGKRIDDTTA